MANTLYVAVVMTTVYHVASLPINQESRTPSERRSNPYDINGLTALNKNNKEEFQQSLNYIDKTVRQVELLLKSNSSLPRLTRGEILEIIENITKTDLAVTQQKKTNDREQKAVMLVMPFTPNRDDDGKIQDLYTKAPVTQIVGDSKPTSPKSVTRPTLQLKQEGGYRGEVFVEPFPKNASLPRVKSSPADTNPPLPIIKEEAFIRAATAEVRPESYLQFKPLPDISGASEEMEEFLGRFGLGKNAKSNRSERKIQRPQEILSDSSYLNFDVIPDSLRDVAQNLGLFNNDETKTFSRKSLTNPAESGKKEDNTHVFNPMETSYATQEELDKLNQLMEIIKTLEKLNGTASEEDLSQLNIANLKELVGSLQKGDPLSLDEHTWAPNPIDEDLGESKNDVKRQENSTTTTTQATTTITSAPETETVNIKDLEGSFGGSAGSEVIVTVPPPTEGPKTGFYYLLDWNTFLDIDDQKGKRVNLRFQPKAGDPQQFIEVAVP